MQVVTPPAMKGITSDANAWTAVLPLANPPYVIPFGVGKEDVGPAPQAPCLPLETPPNESERGEIRRVFGRDQEVYILGVRLRGGDGSYQSDPGHTRNPHGLLREGPGELYEGRAEVRQSSVGDFHPS